MHRRTQHPRRRTNPTTDASRTNGRAAVSRRRLLAGGAIGAAGAAAVGMPAASAGTPPPAFVSLREPIRLFDSRRPDDLLGGSKLEEGGVVAVSTAAPELEFEPETVFVNLTITDTEGFGYLAVRGSDTRDGVTAPNTSNINWSGPGVTLANLVVSRTGSEYAIDVFCEGPDARTHLIVDLQAYIPLDLSQYK